MEKILSISVAAYNIEKFIKQNIESFIDSEVKEKIEVIITDDGSKDNTPNIVKEYERKYPGIIRLIQQPNAGPGSTINSGLKHANGKYFRMVDGDDWVNTENLKLYINFLEKTDVDMVITNYCTYDNNTGKTEKKIIKDIKEKEYEFETVANNLKLPMHSIAYKTKILRENNIIFDNGFYTDVEYIIFPVPYIKDIAYLNTDIYMYRIGLSTQSMDIKSLQKNLPLHDLVLKRLIDYYEDKKIIVGINCGKYMKNRIADMVISQLAILLSYTPTKENKKVIIELMKYVKIKSKSIYNECKKAKKVKLLLYSNYCLYPLVSKLYLKKI